MKFNTKTLSAITLACFLAGVGFGVWRENTHKRRMAKATPIRVLCHENWLTNDSLETVSRQLGAPIQLYTYSRPSEFLSQMANSDGNIDVICTSSMLVKSLIQSHWIQRADFSQLSNLSLIAVDFLHLPYDAANEYTIPIFWNLYGLFGKGSQQSGTLKQALNGKRMGIWGDELSVFHMFPILTTSAHAALPDEVARALNAVSRIILPNTAPISGESVAALAEWSQLPLGRVARLIGENSPYRFWIPEDGATLEVGVFAIGSKARDVKQSLQLIDALITKENALSMHQRLSTGVVHKELSALASVAPLQRAEALRTFPLNRFRFPELDVETLPRMQKIYDETVALNRKQ